MALFPVGPNSNKGGARKHGIFWLHRYFGVSGRPALANRWPCSNFLPSSFHHFLPLSFLPLPTPFPSSPLRCEAAPLQPARGSGGALVTPQRLQSHFAALYACKTHLFAALVSPRHNLNIGVVQTDKLFYRESLRSKTAAP